MPPALVRSPKSALLVVAASIVAASALALGIAPAGDPPSPPTDPKPTEGAKAPVAPVDAFGDPLPPGAVARLGTVRFRTADLPKQLAVSPDGKRVVSTQTLQHSRLTIWEAGTGRSLREVELTGFPQPEAVCWSADGRGLAAFKTGPADYVVWDFTEPAAKPPTGDQANAFGPGTFTASAFSPDGTLLVGGERAGPRGMAGRLQVWPVRPGRPVREATPLFAIDTADGFAALLFTADGKRLVGITQGREPDRVMPRGKAGPVGAIERGAESDKAHVFVWDVTGGKELASFAVPGGAFGMNSAHLSVRAAVSPDGTTLFTPTREAHVKAFDLATGKEKFDALAFGPPSAATKAAVPNITIGELATTPDGKTLIVAELMGRTVGLDAATGKERWRGGREMDPIYGIAVFPDNKRFALGHGARQIGVYDAATGKPLVEPVGPRGGLVAVGIAPDGRSAITAGWNTNTLHRWDLATGQMTGQVEVESAARSRLGGFSRDGTRAVGHEGVFDTTTGKRVTPRELPGLVLSWSAPGRVAWLSDGTFVVADEENQATRLAADGKTVAEYVAAAPAKRGTGLPVEGVAVRPDGKTVVLAGEGPPENGTRSDAGWVAVFDAATGAKLRDFQSKGTGGFTGAAFLPDGSRVVLGRRVFRMLRVPGRPEVPLDLGTAVALFDPATGETVTPFDVPDPAADSRWVRSVAISPTGAQVAAVEWDNDLTVYETATGAVRLRLKGHRGRVAQIRFTPDGGRLVSVSDDGTGLVWDTAPPRPATPTPLTEADLDRRWAALLATDGQSAHRAMGEMAADPTGAVAFLKAYLKPTPAPTAADLDRLVGKLGTARFADREAAARELDQWGSLAAPGVRAKLPAVTSAEVRQRLDEFLKRHDVPGRTTGRRLREVRAVELLEGVGTPDARAVLADLAAGDTPLARAAAAALRRLREL